MNVMKTSDSSSQDVYYKLHMDHVEFPMRELHIMACKFFEYDSIKGIIYNLILKGGSLNVSDTGAFMSFAVARRWKLQGYVCPLIVSHSLPSFHCHPECATHNAQPTTCQYM